MNFRENDEMLERYSDEVEKSVQDIGNVKD